MKERKKTMTKITDHPIKGTLNYNIPPVDKIYGKIIKDEKGAKTLKTVALIKKDPENPYDSYNVTVSIKLKNDDIIPIGELAQDSEGYNAINNRPKEEYYGELLITEFENKKYNTRYRLSFDIL